MAQTFNMSLDSPSPLVAFTPASMWRPMKPTDDPLATSYANSSTAAVTGFAGARAQASFTFNGTGVFVYGAHRSDNGYYNVTLDAQPSQLFLGTGNNTFQQLLYSATNLADTQHTLNIVNEGPLNLTNQSLTWFDIDWITWEVSLQPPSTSSSSTLAINSTTYPSTHPSITYLPDSPNVWLNSSYTNPSQETIVARSTSAIGASLALNFTIPSGAGETSLGIFGTMNTTNGFYLVSLTRVAPNGIGLVNNQEYPGTYGYNTVHEQLLWFYEHLTPGDYTLNVTNSPADDTRPNFALEYIKTWGLGEGTSPTVPSSPNSSSTPSSTPTPHKGSSHTGAIVGGVVGGVIGLALIAAVLFIYFRRKEAKTDYYAEGEDTKPPEADVSPFPVTSDWPEDEVRSTGTQIREADVYTTTASAMSPSYLAPSVTSRGISSRAEDYGVLDRATPAPEDTMLPPHYDNARQPWESRRD
ncbi:hypothetical protein DL93DRAFT_2166430 [Clavulina sp. PMI_390]|nr:hypothetical protein DL93DRAFT_2166430 [Clavulina sp. PMI_390]